MEAGHLPEVEKHGHVWLEIAIAVVLGLTAVATAFSAYQSGKNERETVAHYNEGIRDSSLSTAWCSRPSRRSQTTARCFSST